MVMEMVIVIVIVVVMVIIIEIVIMMMMMTPDGIDWGLLRDGAKFIGYPGRDHRQGAKTFFRKKLGGRDFFFEKN